MIHLLLAASVVAPPPGLAASAESDVIAWVHVADLDGVLARAAASPLAPVLPLLLPRADLDRLRRHAAAALLVTAHGARAEDLAETVIIDAGSAAAGIAVALRRWWIGRGFAATGATPPAAERARSERLSRGDTSVILFGDAGRVGYTTGRRPPGSVARSPLAGEARFVAVHQAHPNAALLAAVDVHRVFGILARTERAASIAAMIDRLGLLGLQEVTGRVEVASEKIHTVVRFAMRGRNEGLVAALGEPLQLLGTRSLPKGVASVIRIAVRPDLLYYALSKLYGYHDALRYALFVAQLRGIEDRVQVRLDRDVLGDAPRALSFVRLQVDEKGRKSDRLSDVLVAELRSGVAARKLIDGFLAGLSFLSPRTKLRRPQIAGVPAIILDGPVTLALAIAKDRLFVSRSEAALRLLLGQRTGLNFTDVPDRRGSDRPDRDAPALLSMVGAGAPFVSWLIDIAGLPLDEEGRKSGRRARLVEALQRSRSAATLRRVEGGFELDIETRLGP